jgi:hypothetical protein
VIVILYLMAPKEPITFYIFAVALGVTWLATVPPTAGIVGKLFGVRYLGTLFGLTLLSHQIGGFLGAWLGGVQQPHARLKSQAAARSLHQTTSRSMGRSADHIFSRL